MTPSYVLIHGGGMTGRFWDRVVPLLGGSVLAVDLPGRGRHPAELTTITVDDEVESVVSDIAAARLEPPIVVVAHSSGGLVVPGVVATLGPEVVQHVVLNAASVPPEGGDGTHCMKPRHAEGVAKMRSDNMTTPGPPEDRALLRESYGGAPLDDDDLEFVTHESRAVVDGVNHYFQPVSWARAADVPATYVINTLDRAVPLALQEAMVARLPVAPTIVRLDAGHIPAVTMPEELATIIRSVPVQTTS